MAPLTRLDKKLSSQKKGLGRLDRTGKFRTPLAKKFLIATFVFADGNPRIEELKSVFDKASDWLRISDLVWLLWTGRSADTWSNLVRKSIVKDADEVFIIAIDTTDSQGWISKSVWEWFKKERTS